MKLIDLKEMFHGKYLHYYHLNYQNTSDQSKTYEIVSRNSIDTAGQLGQTPSGVSIIAFCDDRLLLLREFRMGVNRQIYNLCAGMLEQNESVEDCIRRELYEETGLSVHKILEILPPSFAAVAISDVSTYFAFIEVSGTLSAMHSSANEEITPAFFNATELREMLKKEEFSSRAQLAAYYFCQMH